MELRVRMIYDMLVVPRHQGKYEIPPVEFTYFDTSTNGYKTVKRKGFTLNVAKGAGPGKVNDFSDQELEELSKDIRYHQDRRCDVSISMVTSSSDRRAIGSVLVVLALTFITLFVVFRQRAIENAKCDEDAWQESQQGRYKTSEESRSTDG